MQPISHDNFLRRSRKSAPNGAPVSLYHLNSICRPEARPLDSAVLAAQLIYQKYKNQIYLPLSGGVDSECMAEAFRLAAVPFKPVIMKFKGGYNDFDTQWADDYCARVGLIPRIIELDLDKFFFSGEHLTFAKPYFCRSPQLATHLWLLDQLDGPTVFPHNPLPLLKHNSKIYVSFPPDLYLCYDNYFNIKKRPGVGLFFLYTTDLIYSFLKLDLYLDAMFNNAQFSKKFSDDQYLFKCTLYEEAGFSFEIRPYKNTGFELYRQHLNSKYSYKAIDYFDTHFRKPMEELVNDNNRLSIGEIDLKKLYELWNPV